MKTMEILCTRFSRIHPGYTAYLNKIESYHGYYKIVIYSPVDLPINIPFEYTFRSCREFSEWMHGVIMD